MIEFFTNIKQGKPLNPAVWRKYLNCLTDGNYLVKIEKRKKRSTNQNSYLHGVIIPMVFDGLRDAGFDEVRTLEDAKLIIKSLFLKKSIVSKSTGEVIEIIQDTSALTTTEFNEFIEAVQKWGSEYLNIYIPNPSEPIKLFNHDSL